MVARANVGLAGEVPDVEPTDELEEYLRTAAVLGEAGPVQGGGAHPDKLRLLLEGGVQVIAKPAVHGNPDSDGNLFFAPIQHFPLEDLWQAAVFDAVVAHGDHNGNNWLAVPAPGGQHPPRLKLVDNGHAFGYPSLQVPPNSTFYLHLESEDLPGHAIEALECLLDGFPIERLTELVDADESERSRDRADILLQRRALVL